MKSCYSATIFIPSLISPINGKNRISIICLFSELPDMHYDISIGLENILIFSLMVTTAIDQYLIDICIS